MSDLIVKANPTYSDLHRSRPLTDLSIAAWQRNAGKYRSALIFPRVGVQKKSDRFYVYERDDFLRSHAQRRAPGAPAMVAGWRLSDAPYECDRWALAKDIADPERANADPGFNLEADAVEFVTDQVELAAENEFVSDFFRAGVWDGASSSTDMTGLAAPASTASNFLQWNDLASDPIRDVRGEALAIEQKTGLRPNTFVMGPQVEDVLLNHPDILDRIKYTQTGVASGDLLAQLFGVERVITLRATQNTAREGAATGTYSFLAGKHAALFYVAPNPGLKTATAGLTFVWTGAGVPLQGVAIKRYRIEERESDRIEGETWLDFVKVSSVLGAFFKDAVA